MRPAVRPIVRFAPALALALAAAGCPGQQRVAAYPSAEQYGVQVSFIGEWLGEVAGIEGILKINELSPTRYYGQFRSDDGSVIQSWDMAPVMEGGAQTNLVKLEWQDGRGDQGLGWLLINREDSALTGSLGRGENRTAGFGDVTFIRLE
jgi:hypothetical protein